jgi:glycolate oxidase iron-sulfur subunit
LLDLLSEPRRLGRYVSLHNFARKTGLLRLAKSASTKRVRRLLELGQHLPEKETLLSDLYASKQPSGRLVQLFTGCVGSQTEQLLLKQAITTLTRLGYAVEIPKTQSCCGALHRHNGYPDEADQLIDINQQQLKKSRAASLITLATACHLELEEHLQSDITVQDLTSFLLDLPQKSMPKLHPLEKRAVIHTPCSSRNDRSRELLQQIPSLEIIDLPDDGTCCGAAGSYLLTQPELSTTLGERKLEALKKTEGDILITTNTGCAMQFRELIREHDLQMEVMHPTELYAQQLESSA